MQTKFLNNSITHIGLLVICFGVFGLSTTALGINAPIHGGPFQDIQPNPLPSPYTPVYNFGEPRGQSKLGKLTIGGSSTTTSPNLFLEVIGNLKITPQPPSATGGLTSGYGAFPALQVLGSGFAHTMIVMGGDPSLVGVLPTPSPMPGLFSIDTGLDIRGGIQLDPTIANLDWNNKGYFYTDPVTNIVSTTEKPLCGNATGDIILCP